MATLKSLVDETGNIKNELVECHTNLKNNLIAKGVECSDTDKMPSLINKVGAVGINTVVQKGIVSMNKLNSIDVDISDVDLSRSICYTKPNPTDTLSTGAPNVDTICTFSSENRINIRSYNAYTGSSWSRLSVYWEVIEFVSGVNRIYNYRFSPSQLNIGKNNTITVTHNLNIKNPDKCIIYFSYCVSESTTDSRVDIFNLTNNTFSYHSHCTVSDVNVYFVELL